MSNQFSRYVEEVKGKRETEEFKALDDETKLKLYGYARQGQSGDCTEEHPGDSDPIALAKHEVWVGLKGTDQKEAQA